MKINKIVISLASIAMFSAVNSHSEVNPYSDCGIGAALFKKSDTGAVISNVIWDLGTTAITSATASPDTCSGADADAAAFIIESYDNLVEDTAKGSGEYLDALLSILNVKDSDKQRVITTVRSDIARVVSDDAFTNASLADKANYYYQSVVASI